MRTSILTRSAVAVASLAIGSVALTAAPAIADAPSGVTRELIVNSTFDYFVGGDQAATKTLITKVCGPGTISDFEGTPFSNNISDDVQGILVQAYLDYDPDITGSGRSCTFAALASSSRIATLSGNVTISADQFQDSAPLERAAPLSTSSPLSGDVYVTSPITDDDYLFRSTAEASGNVTKVEQATTSTTRVSKPKSTSYKAKALKSYKRSIAKAEAKLSKALKKAGDSSSKKAAARKAFKARKKAAKATLHIRWSSDKKTVVTTKVGKTTTTPFSLSTNNRL